MFKVVQINTFPHKATGAIMLSIHKKLQESGWDSYVAWGRGCKPKDSLHEISFEDKCGTTVHGIMSRVFDNTGFYSKHATQQLLDRLEYIMPDVIHLHNLHGYYIHIGMLFDWIKRRQIPVVWTLHDCWSFTGHCCYFDYAGCEKWKTGCHDCKQLKSYPSSMFRDASSQNWKRKKELFAYKQLHLVTPSEWLSGLVRESYLNDATCRVIHNGIDTNVFCSQPDSHNDNNLSHKMKILGVASEWTPRKGLNDFVKLYEMLGSEKVEMTLVGLTTKQMKSLPTGIKGMERTNNVEQLVKLYQKADLFFNPTYEDNYPTTNLEAIACGTPVCTYATGGSVESVNATNGFIVEPGQLGGVKSLIENHLHERKMGMSMDSDIHFLSQEHMADQYINLYKEILI